MREALLAPMVAPALPDEVRSFSLEEEEAPRRMEQSFHLPLAAAERAAVLKRMLNPE